MAEKLDDRAREIIDEKNVATIATLREDGSPQVNVIWVGADGDDVLVNSAEGRAWPQNLARDPRVALTVARPEKPEESVAIRGRVTETIGHDEGAWDNINELSHKYRGDDYPRIEGQRRVLFRIEPESVHHHDA
jgi:PPOX class probable F420-dependent enzyme